MPVSNVTSPNRHLFKSVREAMKVAVGYDPKERCTIWNDKFEKWSRFKLYVPCIGRAASIDNVTAALDKLNLPTKYEVYYSGDRPYCNTNHKGVCVRLYHFETNESYDEKMALVQETKPKKKKRKAKKKVVVDPRIDSLLDEMADHLSLYYLGTMQHDDILDQDLTIIARKGRKITKGTLLRIARHRLTLAIPSTIWGNNMRSIVDTYNKKIEVLSSPAPVIEEVVVNLCVPVKVLVDMSTVNHKIEVRARIHAMEISKQIAQLETDQCTIDTDGIKFIK